MSEKPGIFSKLGKAVNETLESVDEVFDKAGDAVKEAVKSAEPEYIVESYSTMSEVANSLNDLAANKHVKYFEIVSIVKNDAGRFEILLLITRK